MIKPLTTLSSLSSIDITSPSIIVAGFQILLTSTAYFNEKTNQTPYSKFAIGKNNNISSKFGMLIIYVPALCYCIYNTMLKIPNINDLSLPSIDYSDRGLLIAIMLTIHFLKRTLETLFLHKYSGGTSLSTSIPIGIYYTLVSVIVSYFSLQLPISLYNQRTSIVGIIFFVIGQLGNFYHHYLLANLRKTSVTNDKESITKNYKVPKGGLFDYVTMPHYFFELIAWLGVALTSQQLNSFLVFCSMFSYLAGRSVATQSWYKNNIKNYSERKNIVPFIF